MSDDESDAAIMPYSKEKREFTGDQPAREEQASQTPKRKEGDTTQENLSVQAQSAGFRFFSVQSVWSVESVWSDNGKGMLWAHIT